MADLEDTGNEGNRLTADEVVWWGNWCQRQ